MVVKEIFVDLVIPLIDLLKQVNNVIRLNDTTAAPEMEDVEIQVRPLLLVSLFDDA